MNLMLKRACCVVIYGWVDDLLVIRAESKPAAGRIPKSEDLAVLASTLHTKDPCSHSAGQDTDTRAYGKNWTPTPELYYLP